MLPVAGHALWRTDADGNLVLGEGMTLKEAQAELERLWAEAEKHPDNSDLDPGEFAGPFFRPSTRWAAPSGRMQVYESRDPTLIAKGKAIGEAARRARG